LKSHGVQATLVGKAACRYLRSPKEKPPMPESDEDLNKTVYSDSAVGHRLSKVRKPGAMFIVFKGRQIPITSRITVGRDADNTIELDDALASRHHAVVQKVKDDFFIEDLDSTNGTYVNGHPVPPGKYVRLHRLDVILIGRTELSLQQFGV
jgi:pSer/pThr/pTyr-binding forkhead associated (FHA) protein